MNEPDAVALAEAHVAAYQLDQADEGEPRPPVVAALVIVLAIGFVLGAGAMSLVDRLIAIGAR